MLASMTLCFPVFCFYSVQLTVTIEWCKSLSWGISPIGQVALVQSSQLRVASYNKSITIMNRCIKVTCSVPGVASSVLGFSPTVWWCLFVCLFVCLFYLNY